MSVTETSIVAGVMTFVGYCAIPLSILFYITGGKRRRAKRAAADARRAAPTPNPSDSHGGPDSADGSGD